MSEISRNIVDSVINYSLNCNDDEYDGYYIPKGTVVLGNSWSVRMIATLGPDFLI